MAEIREVRIDELRPNNWYLNRGRLDRVRSAWASGREHELPPVLVAMIDGQLSLIDGHARTFAAWEAGATTIPAVSQPLDQIEGSTALYRHIHTAGPEQGICSIADLHDRILEPDDHRRIRVGYCSDWLRDNDGK